MTMETFRRKVAGMLPKGATLTLSGREAYEDAEQVTIYLPYEFLNKCRREQGIFLLGDTVCPEEWGEQLDDGGRTLTQGMSVDENGSILSLALSSVNHFTMTVETAAQCAKPYASIVVYGNADYWGGSEADNN